MQTLLGSQSTLLTCLNRHSMKPVVAYKLLGDLCSLGIEVRGAVGAVPDQDKSGTFVDMLHNV